MLRNYPYTNFHDLNLDWLLKTVKELVATGQGYAEIWEAIQKEIAELKNKDLFPEYIEQLEAWVNKNLESFVSDLVKFVFFGLSDAGYFIAYIPESWNEIDFGTSGTDTFIPGVDYGHLILRY